MTHLKGQNINITKELIRCVVSKCNQSNQIVKCVKMGNRVGVCQLLPCRKSDALGEYTNRKAGRLCLYTFRNCQKNLLK